MSDVKLVMADLVNILNDANSKYAVGLDTGMTDNEYDVQFRKLKVLEEKHPDLVMDNSPTRKVGAVHAGQYIKHKQGMLSLANVFTVRELMSWIANVVKKTRSDYTIENKMDGLAISLTYIDGHYAGAATRGDGIQGENCSSALAVCNGVPKDVELFKGQSIALEVHGELVMPNAKFIKLNEFRAELGETPYLNPRNAAAGVLRSKNLELIKVAGLTFIPYGGSDELFKVLRVNTYMEAIALLRPDFPTIDLLETRIYHGESLEDDSSRYMDREIGTDGLVVKVNNLTDRKAIGVNSHEPKWAVAYKYQAFIGVSTLLGVTWQVGRTRRLTPVAEIDATTISGSTIRRVTLHNLAEIKRLKIKLGSAILVSKQADVIPKITEANDTPNCVEIPMPTECPCCKSSIELVDAATNPTYVCTNVACSGALVQNVLYLCSRKVLNIDGIGIKVAERLVELGYVKEHPLSIFKLTVEELTTAMESEIQAAKVHREISSASTMSLDKFINSLCIPNVGSTASKRIAPLYTTIDSLDKTPLDHTQVSGIGEVLAIQWNTNIGPVLELVSKYITSVNLSSTEYITKYTSLDGLKFVITGSFGDTKRDQIALMINTHGGEVMGSVSKNTNYLVAGDSAGSKLAKATKLGIPVIGLNELRNMIK